MAIHIDAYADVLELLPGLRYTSTTNGTAVDCKDYDGRATVALTTSAGGGTTPTLDVKVEHSADNSTFADVSGATFTQVTDAADSTEGLVIDLGQLDRYVRVTATIAGTSPTFDGGVVMVASKKYIA